MKGTVLSAGVVVVRRFDGEPRYLLLRVFRYWDFPKGLVEPGEGPLEGARREVREEAALADLDFRWGPEYRETPPYGPQHKVARYYLAESSRGEVTLPVSPELGRPEHHEFRWAGFEAARDLLNDRLRPVLEWAHDRVTGAAPPVA